MGIWSSTYIEHFFLLIIDADNWELHQWSWLVEESPAFLFLSSLLPGLHTPSEEKAQLC